MDKKFEMGSGAVGDLLAATPELRPLFLRWVRAAAKGKMLPETFTTPNLDFEAQRRLEKLLMTRTARTADGRVYGTLLPMLREPSVWLEVATALGVAQGESNVESVSDFLLRLRWLHPEAAGVLTTLGGSLEVVRHLSEVQNRVNWKTLFESVLYMTQHLAGRFLTLSQLGSDWFNDSKSLRSGPLRRQLVLILAALSGMEAEDERGVLATLGIEENPYTSSVTVFAPFVFELQDGTCFDFPFRLYRQGLVCQLPAETVLSIARIEWLGETKEIATSENAAPLLRFVGAGKPVLYTEGYPNYAVRTLLVRFAEQELVAEHWGDADLDGLRIAAFVQSNLPGSRVVAVDILANPNGLTGIALTDTQRRRLERFIEQNPTCPYMESLKHILVRGCWYEQESFPFAEGE